MATLRVEVVYALPGREDRVALELPAGSTAGDAVRASGLLARHPELDLAVQKLGIYARVVPAGTGLRDGDRVELYRSLALEPREARRRRVRPQRKRTSA